LQEDKDEIDVIKALSDPVTLLDEVLQLDKHNVSNTEKILNNFEEEERDLGISFNRIGQDVELNKELKSTQEFLPTKFVIKMPLHKENYYFRCLLVLNSNYRYSNCWMLLLMLSMLLPKFMQSHSLCLPRVVYSM
jgi:hypothetical protein